MTSARPDPGEQGFSLIELMVGLVIASILISFVFAVTGKMSVAFRRQNQVTGVQQTVRSASVLIASELRQAGLLLGNGFRTSAWGDPAALVPAVEIFNDSDDTGPDQLRLFYADTSASGRVKAMDANAMQWADVEHPTGFQVGDMVILANGELLTDTEGNVSGISYLACAARVTDIAMGDPARFTFAADKALNTTSNQHCSEVAAETAGEAATTDTAIYRLVGRSYRIDPERRDVSVLQVSPSGELVDDDWSDLALGVTTIQLASRYRETGDKVDVDGDGDPEEDWYSSNNQESPDPTKERPASAALVEISLGIEGRTPYGIRGVTSAWSADFTGEDPDHNERGDWAALSLQELPDKNRPEAYRGDHVLRFSRTVIKLRNLGLTP